MTYLVTARKWRPRTFDEVVAQDHITKTLKNAVISERITQCYLLCGPRGVGKTTTARILAKALNCEERVGSDPCNSCSSCESITNGTNMNVLEIDGASNNGVDDIRELREVVRYASTQGKYKIYIIDEVHMLSKSAFNALLKTLEEPPQHVVFIFATTEVENVPDTIKSRCQRFNFHRVGEGRIVSHLRYISENEGIACDERALYLLANRADGALRDAESLFDQVVSYDDDDGITIESVQQVLGLVDRKTYFEIILALQKEEPQRILQLIDSIIESGAEVEEISRGLVEVLRRILLAKVHNSVEDLDIADEDRVCYKEMAKGYDLEDLLRMLQVLMDLHVELRRSIMPRFRFEIALVRLGTMGRAVDIGNLLAKIRDLEKSSKNSTIEYGDTDIATVSAGADSVPEKLVDSDRRASSAVVVDPKAKFDQNELFERWAELIEAVFTMKPALSNFLKKAQLLGLEGKTVRLAFDPNDRFALTQINSNKPSIEGVLRERFGQILQINASVSEGIGKVDDTKKDNDPIDHDPTIRSVLDTFDGEMM